MGDDWPTPEWLMEFFPGCFDPCPIGGTDGLTKAWPGRSFVNPPFSKVKEFVAYGMDQEKPQVWFVPFRPDTRWFQTLVARGGQAAYFTSRVYLGSNFASALVFINTGD